MSATIEAVRERPILFSGPIVRAILDGRKTQTRRVVKLPRQATFTNCAVRTWDAEADMLRAIAPEPPDIAPYLLGRRMEGDYLVCNLVDDVGIARVHCPYGQPGDRLWVREAWCRTAGGYTQYRADDKCSEPYWSLLRWKPSIHMPRERSRITLDITNIRVQRVQAISEADAIAEGCDTASPRGADPGDWSTPSEQYRYLWDELNAKRGYGWNVNPFVWVIEFRAVPAPVSSAGDER